MTDHQEPPSPDPSGKITRTIDVPGAMLTYDVRPGAQESATPLFCLASPMAAQGFTTLASHFTDRTVITYDPRQANERSRLTTEAHPSPETHAEDIRAVLRATAVDGNVDVFASSGGAVNMLAFVARHPDVVRTLVAHEPPLVSQLPDRDVAGAALRDIQDAYLREGLGAGMARFLTVVMHSGEFPDDWPGRPAPDPSAFGLPTEDDGSRDDPMLGRGHIVNTAQYQPDYEALRAAATRIVLAYGNESAGLMTQRATVAVAERLGIEPTEFPSHHGGFLGGEYGQTGDPDAFAARLREVLDADG